jgi:hypothetical protein
LKAFVLIKIKRAYHVLNEFFQSNKEIAYFKGDFMYLIGGRYALQLILFIRYVVACGLFLKIAIQRYGVVKSTGGANFVQSVFSFVVV